METRTLPERPSLDQLRHQARELQQEQGATLAEAQRDLARSYGFPSWTRLKRHVEGQSLEAYVADALGRPVDPPPSLAAAPAARALRGDTAGLDPQAAYAPRDWPALLYLALSRHWGRQEERPRLRAGVADLLQRGADPDAHHLHPQYQEVTALYGLAGQANDPEATALMLDAGARLGVADCWYHATEHRDHRVLRLFLARGLDPRGTVALNRMLDFEDPEGLDLLLTAWTAPDEELANGLHHALDRGRGAWAFKRLLAKGADPRFTRQGCDLYARARILGREDVAALVPRSPLQPWQAAFLASREGGAMPSVAEWPEGAGWLLVRLAGLGQALAVGRLVDAGLSPDVRGEGGKTPLHEAGWEGQAETVRALLARGADATIKDHWHDGTPLNWTVAGDAWGVNPGSDHLEAARALLEAGAPGTAGFLKEQSREHPAMRELLQEFGTV